MKFDPLKELTQMSRSAAFIDQFWIVRNPTPESEWIDMMGGPYDSITLAQIVIGTGLSAWKHEKTRIYPNLQMAEKDGLLRMKKLHGPNIPDFVFTNGMPVFKTR